MRLFIAALCLACSPAFASTDEVKYCWNVGSLSSEAMRATVTISFHVDSLGVPNEDSIVLRKYKGASAEQAGQAFDAAKKAVIRCGRSGFKEWKSQPVVLRFAPDQGITEVHPPKVKDI